MPADGRAPEEDDRHNRGSREHRDDRERRRRQQSYRPSTSDDRRPQVAEPQRPPQSPSVRETTASQPVRQQHPSQPAFLPGQYDERRTTRTLPPLLAPQDRPQPSLASDPFYRRYDAPGFNRGQPSPHLQRQAQQAPSQQSSDSPHQIPYQTQYPFPHQNSSFLQHRPPHQTGYPIQVPDAQYYRHTAGTPTYAPNYASSEIPRVDNKVEDPETMVGKEGLPRKRPPCGVKAKFKDEDDQLLRQLKEDFPNLGLTWKQISDFFPGRSPGTLQVRYCTKIRKKDILWNDDTITRLKRAIREVEADKWRQVAQKLGHSYTGDDCKTQAEALADSEAAALALQRGDVGPVGSDEASEEEDREDVDSADDEDYDEMEA